MSNDFMPDCALELYRGRQKGTGHRYDLSMQRQAHYLANRQKLAAAAACGLPILGFGGYASCGACRTADHDTMTSAEDDYGRVICRNPSCPQHRAHEGKSVPVTTKAGQDER